MIKPTDIKKLKKKMTSGITYKKIADASDGKVSESQVKNFFGLRSCAFNAQLEIVKITNTLIVEQENQVSEVLG